MCNLFLVFSSKSQVLLPLPDYRHFTCHFLCLLIAVRQRGFFPSPGQCFLCNIICFYFLLQICKPARFLAPNSAWWLTLTGETLKSFKLFCVHWSPAKYKVLDGKVCLLTLKAFVTYQARTLFHRLVIHRRKCCYPTVSISCSLEVAWAKLGSKFSAFPNAVLQKQVNRGNLESWASSMSPSS